jgi:hypothetical protein
LFSGFVVNSEPHTGARLSVRVFVGPELSRCVVHAALGEDKGRKSIAIIPKSSGPSSLVSLVKYASRILNISEYLDPAVAQAALFGATT